MYYRVRLLHTQHGRSWAIFNDATYALDYALRMYPRHYKISSRGLKAYSTLGCGGCVHLHVDRDTALLHLSNGDHTLWLEDQSTEYGSRRKTEIKPVDALMRDVG